jgi:hypothetical protein
MALHLKPDFARLCGLTTGNLTNYIKRGKVEVDGDYIDDSIQVNKDFLIKRQAAETIKAEEIEDAGEVVQVKKEKKAKVATIEFDDDGGGKSLHTLTKEKLNIEISKKTREDALLQIKIEKIKSELVDVSVIKNLFITHNQSIITAQKDGIEELLIRFSAETRLSSEKYSQLRGEMVNILNRGVDKAIIITEKSLQAQLNEIAIKKEVGEHD